MGTEDERKLKWEERAEVSEDEPCMNIICGLKH